MKHPEQNITKLTDHLFRENSGKMISVLTPIFGLKNLELVSDVVQDTFETALTQWRYGNLPDNPEGWLMQVARNKAINALKRDSKLSSFNPSAFSKNAEAEVERQVDHLFLPHEVEDSQLRLLLTCCHPDFSEKNQVILTLHILCGFSAVEISNALLMNYEAVKKALTRTKAQLRDKGDILKTPMLLQYESRIHTVHQDRSQWNHALIREGYFYLNQSMGEKLSPFHLEALIASVHCASANFEETDWQKIVFLYDQLEEINPTPFTRLNKILAHSYLHHAEDALAELQELKQLPRLKDHYLLYAAEGDLLKRSGKFTLAGKAFNMAHASASSPGEKEFLARRITECLLN